MSEHAEKHETQENDFMTFHEISNVEKSTKIVEFPGKPGKKVTLRQLGAEEILSYFKLVEEIKEKNTAKQCHVSSLKVAMSLANPDGSPIFQSVLTGYETVVKWPSDTVQQLGVIVEGLSPTIADAEVIARAKKLEAPTKKTS